MAKRKKRAQGNDSKRGAPEHFSGFKLDFLVSRVASYLQCIDSKSVSEFYDKVTRDFIMKYGHKEPFNRNPDEDLPDPVKDPQEPLSKEKAEENSAIFIKLRTVSIMRINIVQCSDSGTETCTVV